MEESKYGEDGPVGLWQDPDFPPSKESIGELNGDEVPDIVWLRPRQFSSKYANKDRPFVLFDGENRSGDLTLTSEKILDDSFFMGALSAVASHPSDFIESLFVNDAEVGLDVGRVTVQFYTLGTWSKVQIDTLIPCDANTMMPIFARSVNGNEIWVVLLEKAYAKLKGSYAGMCDGRTGIEDVLVNLTGGTCVLDHSSSIISHSTIIGTCRRVPVSKSKSSEDSKKEDEDEDDDDEKTEARLQYIRSSTKSRTLRTLNFGEAELNVTKNALFVSFRNLIDCYNCVETLSFDSVVQSMFGLGTLCLSRKCQEYWNGSQKR